MAPKKKPVSTGLRELGQYTSLKELYLDVQDYTAKWYKLKKRSPRVGFPTEQATQGQVIAAIEALTPVLQRLQRRRSRHPDEPSADRLPQTCPNGCEATVVDVRTLAEVGK